MAHTDVHRPSWVQREDPTERHRWHRVGANRWPEYNTCGCPLCTGAPWRRQQRRRERRAGRRECAQRGE